MGKQKISKRTKLNKKIGQAHRERHNNSGYWLTMSTSQLLTLTFEYQGNPLPFNGLTEDRMGILSEGRILRMFPAVRLDGGGLDSASLPPVGPTTIRPVTIRIPELCATHTKTVAAIYKRRRNYHETITLEKHVKEFPADGEMRAGEFEGAKQAILNESLKNFSQTQRCIKAIWDKHGTNKMANAVGLLSFESQICLVQAFKNTGLSDAQSWLELARLKWVAIYNNPAKTRLYLYDVIEQPNPMAATQAVRNEVESKSRIYFANGFREIRHPLMTVKIPKARSRAQVLRALYELWKASPSEWTDWPKMAMEAGYSDPGSFFRTVEDRNRPEIRKVIQLFVEADETPGKGSRVRLNPDFHYQKLD